MNLHQILDRLKSARTGLNYKRKRRRRCAVGQSMDRLLRIELCEPRILLASDLNDGLINDVLLKTSPQEMTDGFFTFFDGVVDSLQQTFDQVSTLPLIGDQIQQGVEPFFQTLDQIGDDLETLIGDAYVTVGLDPMESLVDLYEVGLFGIFGPSGLNVLEDGSDPGNDLSVTDIVRSSGSDEPGAEWVQWDIHLGQKTSVTLPFEFGLDFADLDSTLFSNFGFNIDAGEGIQFDLFWDLRLGFGATVGNPGTSVEPGFFINSGAVDQFSDDVEELRAGVEVFSAGDPGITADVALGLVNGRIEDGTVTRTQISAGGEVVLATDSTFDQTYETDFMLTIEDGANSTPFHIALPPVQESFAEFVTRLNLELIDEIGTTYTPVFPAVIATPDFSGINGLFSSEGQGGPSLIFTATTPDIGAMTIEFVEPSAFTFPIAPGLAIPASSTVTSDLDITTAVGLVGDVDLSLNITHQNVEDLTAVLISPDGTRVELFAGVGANGDDFLNTTFDDDAATPIADGSPPFTGSFQPAEPLADFSDNSANGIWTLEITNVGVTAGTLADWSLDITRSSTATLSTPSSTLGFGQKQFEDGRSQAIGFSGDEMMVGNELLAAADAPAEGGLAEDVEFTLMVDGTEVPIVLRTTSAEDVGSLDDLQELLAEALADSLSQAGLDPAGVDILVEGDKFKFVANAGQVLAVESDGLETTKLSLIFTVDATHPDAMFDADMIDPDDQSTFNRVTLQDMQTAKDAGTLTDLLPPVLAAEGEIRFHVDANAEALSNFAAQGLGLAGDSLGLPEIEFDLKIDPSAMVTYSQITGFETKHEFGAVQFDNIAIDIGSLLRDILQPFAAVIDQTIGPLLSVVGPSAGATAGLLNAPIPLLDQISGLLGIDPPSLLDLTGNGEDLNKFLDAVQGIAGFSSEITDTLSRLAGDPRPITIGCLQHEAGAGLVNCEFAAAIESIDLEDFLGLPEFDWDPGGFMVDILTPESITNMILGNPFQLVSYALPKANISLGSTFGFDWRILDFNIDATATLNLGGDTGFGFVYDSTGLESIIASARAGEIPDYGDLLDGFFIQTDPDNPELSLQVDVGGSGSVDVKILSVSANAQLHGQVFLDVVDPNGEDDGEIRLDEIFTLTDNFNRPEKLINLFDAGVNLSGSFGLGGSIGISPFDASIDAGDLGLPTNISVNLQLRDIFGSFTDVPLDTTPVLATPIYQNGRRLLRINAGPHANARAYGNTTDGDETFTVSGSNQAVLVQFNGISQTYNGFYHGILAAGGLGNNTLDFSGVSDLPIEIHGGDGTDVLLGGDSNDTIHGGAGNDTIRGRGGNDFLDGEAGDDFVFGDGGHDQLRGGLGVDMLHGDAGNDTVEGGSGKDKLFGGDDNDVLRGQSGDDELRGEAGNDLLEGGFGDDMLFGGTENDTLRGGRGADMLDGEAGNDSLSGGTGADDLLGGTGNDLLRGDSGSDDLDGGTGNDELHGGGGSDNLLGGANDDVLFGDESNDTLNGGLDADVLYGNIGDDLLIADVDDKWVQGHEGFDTFRIDQRGASAPFEGTLTSNTINRLANITTYLSVEQIEVFLSNLGGDLLRVRGTDLPLSITGGDNNDTVIVQDVLAATTIDGKGGDDTMVVRKAQAAVTIAGGDGAADEFVLDLTLDFNGLIGSLVDNGFTGLGFGGVPVTYDNDVEKFTVNLGAGVDLLDVAFTASGVNATINAKDGDDVITIQSIVGLTSINGDMDSDTVIVPITGDPNLLDETTYANLALNVETLRVVHSGAQLTDWRVEDGAVRVSTLPCHPGEAVGCGILNTIGAERIVINAGSNPSDTITVANNAPTRQTLTIENNTVDVEVGSLVLDFTAQNQGSFVSRQGEAFSVVISPDGLDAYAVRSGNGAPDGTIEVYQRNPLSGDLIFLQELNTGTPSDLLGATALTITADGSRVYVATPAGSLFAFDREPSLGELTFDPFGIRPTLTGANFIKESGHGDRLYIASDSIGGFGTAEGVQGALPGSRVGGIEVDAVPTIDTGTVSDPTPMKGQFNGSLNLSDADDAYVGKYLRFTDGESFGHRRLIADYIGSTRTFVFDTPFPEMIDLFNMDPFVIEERIVEYVFVSQAAPNPTPGDIIQVFGRVPEENQGEQTVYEHLVGKDVLLAGSAGALAFSPDGTKLYIANPADNSITKLDWDRSTETLSNLATVTNGVGDTEGLEGVASLVVTDTSLFAVGASGNSVAAFARDGAGVLSFLQAIQDKGERAGGLAVPNRVTVTPDGKFIYVSSTGDNGVSEERNPGGVAWLAIDEAETPDVMSFDFPDLGDFIDTPGQAFSTVVSSDGLHTYTVRRDTSMIEVYKRDATTGDLIFVEDISFPNANSLAISPGGEHIYVVGSGNNNVSRFERNIMTGELTTELKLPVSPVVIDEATDIRISPTGEQVYITGAFVSSQIFVFDRDLTDGTLTHSITLPPVLDTLANDVTRVSGIDVSLSGEFLITSHDIFQLEEQEGEQVVVWQRVPDGGGGPPTYNQIDTHLLTSAGSVAISPDGAHVFVARPRVGAITVFSRNVGTGVLTELQTVQNNVDGVRGLTGVSALAVSEKFVYALGTDDDSAVVFRRSADGTIVFEQRLLDQAGGVKGLQNGNSLSLSPDRQYLYVGSTGGGPTSGGVAWLAVDEDAAPPAAFTVEHIDVKSLTVASAGGNDLVRLRDAFKLQAGAVDPVPVTIDTKGGSDQVDIRTQADSQVATIDLGAGSDTLDLRSNGDSSSVIIHGGDGQDRVNVWSTGTNNITEISTEVGDDTIRVAGKQIGSDVMIDGGEPVMPELPGDTLLFDPANPTPGTPNTDPFPPLVAGTGTVKVIGAFSTVHYVSIETPRIINPPIPTATDPLAINEGESFDALNSLDIMAVIPFGGDATFSWDLDGDGTFGDIPDQTGGNGDLLSFEITWEQLVARGIDDDGTYMVTARVTDLSSEFAETTATLTINNLAPSVSISSDDTSVDVGQPFELKPTSSDPGTDSIESWTIDWGDGGLAETFLGDPALLTHSYATTGVFTVHVDQITDEDGDYNNPAPSDVVVTVTEVLPITTTINGPTAIAEGATYSLDLSSLQGGGPVTGLVWKVNWGDGVIQESSANPISLNHTYDGPATYVISATTTDANGVVTVAENSILPGTVIIVDVTNVAPVLTLSTADPTTFDEAAMFTLDLASFDPGTDTISSWTVNWGDGTTDTVVGNPSSLMHTYDDGPDVHTISATANDEDGTYAANTLGVTVNNIAPTLMISGAPTTDEGAVYTLTLGSSDPGNDSISNWKIDWGDGSALENVSGGTQALTHIYSDGPDNHSIIVSATDEDGTYAAGTIDVAVNDLPPAPISIGQASIFEGSQYTLSLVNADPGEDVINGWVIDWGDGSGFQIVSGNPETVTHTYADGGPSIFEPNFLHASGAAVPTIDNDTIQSSIVVGGVTGALRDVDVTLDITHPNLADLEIFLVGPDSTRLALVSAGTASGADLTDTTFDDLAPVSFVGGSAPYTGSFRPADPLARLANIEPNGTWTLEITDTGSASTGVLTSWSLAINENVSNASTVRTIMAAFLDEANVPHVATPLSVGIFNEAPEIELDGQQIISLGTVFDLTIGNVTDPGIDTVTEYRVFWGDDTDSEIFAGPGSLAHSYLARGQYTVGVMLVDEDGAHQVAGVHQVDVGLSADFDTDHNINGFDFLAWQRGFGTSAPNATVGDGDADSDLDVDSEDLEIWERQYGNVISPVLPFTAGENTSGITSVESTAPPTVVTAVSISVNHDVEVDDDELYIRANFVNREARSSALFSTNEIEEESIALEPAELRSRPFLATSDLIGAALSGALREHASANIVDEFVMDKDGLLQTTQAAALLEFNDTRPPIGDLDFISLSDKRSSTEEESKNDFFALAILDEVFKEYV